MTLLALKLILAHFIGDFVLQPGHWVEDKLEKKAKSKYLYFHIGVHLLALLIILQFQYVGAIAFIVITHFLFDLGKLYLTNPLAFCGRPNTASSGIGRSRVLDCTISIGLYRTMYRKHPPLHYFFGICHLRIRDNYAHVIGSLY